MGHRGLIRALLMIWHVSKNRPSFFWRWFLEFSVPFNVSICYVELRRVRALYRRIKWEDNYFELEWIRENSIVILRHYTSICMTSLGTIKRLSLGTADGTSDIRIRYFPNTSQKRYSCANLVSDSLLGNGECLSGPHCQADHVKAV
jgi:hypothetical protein